MRDFMISYPMSVVYPIIRKKKQSATYAGMAELADAPDLGSGGFPCRFKSCYPHQKSKDDQKVVFAFFMRDIGRT